MIRVGDKVIFNPWYGGFWVGTVAMITPKFVKFSHGGMARHHDVFPYTVQNVELMKRRTELDNEKRLVENTIRKTSMTVPFDVPVKKRRTAPE